MLVRQECELMLGHRTKTHLHVQHVKSVTLKQTNVKQGHDGTQLILAVVLSQECGHQKKGTFA